MAASLALAFGVAVCASAADTHDYSTYIKLKADTDIPASVGGWPGADKWGPEGVMSNECCYLVPSGKTLTSRTSNNETASGGTWPAMELAIQGTFRIHAKGVRTKCAVTPHLALLPGGTLTLLSVYSTVNAEEIDIRGTAANPSLIQNDASSTNDYVKYYAKLDAAITGDSDAVVKFVYTATGGNFTDFQRAFRVLGGFENFFGTVIVDGERTWLRPETTATTFDIGGTLWVTNGASIYIDTVSPTFGSLVMGSGTTLQLASGKSVTVNGPFSIAEGAKIVVDGTTSFKTDYDTGSNSPIELPVISVCGAANAAAVDRDVLFAAIKAGSEGLVHLGGIPRLKLVESARGDGGVDFKLSHDPFVAQITSCGASQTPYGTDGYLDFLSDGQEISPGKDYYTPNLNIYFKTPYTFPGRSWTVYMVSDRTFGFYGGDSITVPDLRIIGAGGGKFRQMSPNINAYLYGNATIYGSVNFRVSGSNRFYLQSNLSGPGDIVVTLDNERIKEKGSACCGTLSLGGDNSSYAGRFLVGWGKSAVENVEGLTNLTLRATSSTSLGGALDAFTFDAVKIADTCTLTIVSNSTFAAENRGWCLLDGSTVNVDASVTAAMREAVTFGGAVVKTGAGTLILGGSAKHYDGENDAAVDTPNGASFRVAEGGFGATSSNALSGVSVTFAAGTKLLALPETDGLVLGSAPTFEGGTLPVEIVNEDALEVGTVNILTLPTAVPFDTATLSVARLRKFNISAVQSRVDGDNTVYFVTFSKIGARIIIR